MDQKSESSILSMATSYSIYFEIIADTKNNSHSIINNQHKHLNLNYFFNSLKINTMKNTILIDHPVKLIDIPVYAQILRNRSQPAGRHNLQQHRLAH